MAIFGLVFLVVALVSVGLGLAIGLLVCGVTAALVGLGIVSSSIVIGVLKGGAVAAVRAFLLQCGILAGTLAGVVCSWLGQDFLPAYFRGWSFLVAGALGGAVTGLMGALLLQLASRRMGAG